MVPVLIEPMANTSEETTDQNLPNDVKQADAEHLRIEWNDGHESTYHVFYLRYHCPCAHCVDEVTGERRIEADDVRKDVRPVRIESVGNYAMRVEWDDGHDTGIYSFEFLRELCPCEECNNLDVTGPDDLPHE